VNEFFWESKETMLELANNNGFDALYQDARTAPNRHIYNVLQTLTLSEDVQKVLDMANELLKKSIRARMLMHEEHPEYHLNAWDAGYAQLKLVWKEYYPEEFKAFRQAYKEFEDRMREGVYKFRFLK